MLKEKTMQSNTSELKALAKAMNASLKRAGHTVPHTAVLNALACAMDKRNWNTLKAIADATSCTQTPAQPIAAKNDLATMGRKVFAEVHTDDRVAQVHFDARGYLAQATDQEIASIVFVGFRNAEPMDRIAEWERDRAKNADVQDLFAYLGVVGKNPASEVGFECRVNATQMLEWLAEHRTQTLAHALCEFHGVGLVQAEEEEIKGMWDWMGPNGTNSDGACETEDEAAMDAYVKLGLLQETLDL